MFAAPRCLRHSSTKPRRWLILPSALPRKRIGSLTNGRARSPLRAEPCRRKRAKEKVRRPREWSPYLFWQTGDQFTQETLDFVGVLQPITRCRHLRLFANKNADPAFLERAERVLIGAIIADENRTNPAWAGLQLQRFQQPEHCFALIPINIGQQFVNFLSVDPAQLAM